MRYGILGVTEAWDERGVALALGGARVRALLAALALRTGRAVATETLIDAIWTDEPPQDPPAALQALVGRLRRAVGKDAVAGEPGGYRLTAAEDDVDLFVFERLTRRGTTALHAGDASSAARDLAAALALWRGPALADLPDRTAAARPETLRLAATRARIAADLARGRAQDVVPELSELTAVHPYDEILHAHLVRALRDSGRGADALAAYEHARRTLADGLGADPGPELRSLHAELLDRDAGSPRDAGSLRDAGRPSDAGLRPGARSWTAASPRPSTASPHPASLPQPESPPHRAPLPRPETPSHPASAHQPPLPQPETAPAPPEQPARTGNIRPRLNSFVGRELELDALRSELHRARLVTLTGPGGSGKTRLAEEAAAGLPQAWLVELAPLDRPEAVPGAVVNALGLRETVLMTNDLAAPQDDPVALLIEHCAPRGQLLILDNCEHVIGAAAGLAETLLTHCPGLTILATSREPLGVPGESVRPVEPLRPDQAHRLFAERASAVRPDPDAVLRDRAAVAEICRRLDGLPLAIELAAARLRMLTPRQIADRLDDRFRLLTAGSRTALPRQQTLRAVVDWSWDLLDEPERETLREVSVFAGGWDLDAAEAVCGGDRTAELLGALVDKSLVAAAPHERDGGGSMRYRMLETIQEYAAERAAETPARRADTEARHLAWARALAREADPLLRSAGQLPWIARLETELDNIRAALQRAITTGKEAQAGDLALAMGWFWWLRNYRQEGVRWIESVLRLAAADAPAEDGGPAPFDLIGAYLAAAAEPEPHPHHALRTHLRMLHLFLGSDTEPMDGLADPRSEAYVDRLRARYERGGPEAARMPGLLWPLTAFHRRDRIDPLPVLEAAIGNCRRFGGDWELAATLMFRVHLLVDALGGMEGVDDDLAELRGLSRRSGDRWLRAQVCSAAGEAAMPAGRFEEARGEYEEALRLAYEVRAFAETPFLMVRLAEIAYRTGDRPAAVARLEEADRAAQGYGVPDARAYVALMRAQIALDAGDVGQARAWCEASRRQGALGTPPPHFAAALGWLTALVTAAESGPARGLPLLAEALDRARAAGCAESMLAGLVNGAAELSARLGDFPRAARLLAAADRLLDGRSGPLPQCAETDRTDAAAREALGPDRHTAERARGAKLTIEDVLHDLHDLHDLNGLEHPNDPPASATADPATPPADPSAPPTRR
ncbi:BTAD domain-containing putative transcriptional regulator [Streptomyces sp. NPDC056716]|uniref:AfsR/SARP family transcriptional regulator n=1 Tax=unclassified Streptomyces TaxID=2593676 RepID=UPI0036BF0475